MPYVKIWVHLIWTTKNREPFILPELKPNLLTHIKTNAGEKGITLDTINAVADHVHCLVLLKSDHTIAKVVQLLKGESSHWINSNHLVPFQFEWQDEYIAVSVSSSAVEVVRKYIGNQDKHHEKDSLELRYEEFLKDLMIGEKQ